MIDLSLFSACRILVVGDLMLDEYVRGEVERISPEAPVPVLAVRREEYTPGGAGNVAANLVALGARTAVAGVTGEDRHGVLLRERLRALGIDAEAVVVAAGRPTTRKTRIIADRQQVLRIDRETPQAVGPETEAAILARLEAGMASAGAVLVSDYGKGLLTKPLLAGIIAAAKRRGKPVLVDPKGDDYSRYAGATIITPNRKEAARAAGIAIVDDASLERAAGIIREHCGVERLVITCGPEGMVLFEQGRARRTIRSEARQVFDVSGAGDTVLAVLGLAMAAGADWIEAAGLANAAAGLVVGKAGTATVSRKELSSATNRMEKLKEVEELAALADEIRNRGQRIVLTNGCFDFLHAGHLNLFSASRRFGDVLVVAIDDDDSVRAVKGPGRPVIGVRERVRTLCALEAVDYVVVFSGGELEKIIDHLRPEVLTKGGDYGLQDVVGRRRVEARGGRVELIPVTEGLSSRAVIEKIRRAPAPDR